MKKETLHQALCVQTCHWMDAVFKWEVAVISLEIVIYIIIKQVQKPILKHLLSYHHHHHHIITTRPLSVLCANASEEKLSE